MSSADAWSGEQRDDGCATARDARDRANRAQARILRLADRVAELERPPAPRPPGDDMTAPCTPLPLSAGEIARLLDPATDAVCRAHILLGGLARLAGRVVALEER